MHLININICLSSLSAQLRAVQLICCSQYLLLYPMRSMGERIEIGVAASSTSKGSQVKTTEPIESIKVTNCIIQLGLILARDGLAKNYMGSGREAKRAIFSFSAYGCMEVWMDVWMDVIVFLANDFFQA